MKCEICKVKTSDGSDRCDEHTFVTCPECGSEQADMGNSVRCEECDYGPMPTY